MTRHYEFSRVGGGLRQVLRNAMKLLLKKQKYAKNAKKKRKNVLQRLVKTSECYVTGKGGQAICYEALHRVGDKKITIFSVT